MQLSEKQLIAKNASILAKEFMKHGGLVPPEGMITQSSIQSIETQAEWPFTDKNPRDILNKLPKTKNLHDLLA